MAEIEEEVDEPQQAVGAGNPDVRRVETVKLPSLDDDELGPGVQHVQPSLVRGREGVYIDDPVVSNNEDDQANSGSNSSFSSAMGTPTVTKKKPKKVRTLDYYYSSKNSSLTLNKQSSLNRASKSAAELCPTPDITSHLSDSARASSISLEDIAEDHAHTNTVLSHSPDPLPQRTPIRGSKRRRNASKNVDNYVETHDAEKAPTFTLDIQKFIQFLPADFQLLSIHKLQPSLLQTNNREFIPIPETGVDLFVRARAGLVLQVRSEKRASLLESYVQRGMVPKWATHIEPLPGYLHPIAEKIAPVLKDQAHSLMTECAMALRNQARVVGERAQYDQEVLQRTFQDDRHGYQLAVTRLFDIKEREKIRIHETVEYIKTNMSYEATQIEDVCNYIRGRAQRKYSNPKAQATFPRGRGTRGRGRGGYNNNRPRVYNETQGNQSYNQPRGGGYRGNYGNPQPGTSRGAYSMPPPQEYHTRDRSRDPLPQTQSYQAPPPTPSNNRGNRNTPQDTQSQARDRSRSPLASVSRPPISQGYDNNRVGPPSNNPRPNPSAQPPAPTGDQDLSDRDVQRIAEAFMQRFKANQ